MNEITPTAPQQGMRAPDPILAELWEIKRQLNADASYDVTNRAKAAHEAAEIIRQQLAERAQRAAA